MAGWRKEDEGTVEPCHEFGDRSAENLPIGLDGKDDRDRVGRVAPDLYGVRDAQFDEPDVKLKGFADGAPELGAVNFQGGNVVPAKG